MIRFPMWVVRFQEQSIWWSYPDFGEEIIEGDRETVSGQSSVIERKSEMTKTCDLDFENCNLI